MEIKEIEKNLEFQILNSPRIFGNKVSHTTGMFNSRAKGNITAESTYQKFSKNRLNEFFAGRICAIQAIDKLMPFKQILKVGKDGSPIWPEGLTGSITHSGNIVSAAVLHKQGLNGIGMDVEHIFDMDTAKDLEKEILVPEELEFINPHNFQDVITLIFSAKESIFKAICGPSGFFLNFEDIHITSINFSSNYFVAKIGPDLSIVKNLKGRFAFFNSLVFTGVEINGP